MAFNYNPALQCSFQPFPCHFSDREKPAFHYPLCIYIFVQFFNALSISNFSIIIASSLSAHMGEPRPQGRRSSPRYLFFPQSSPSLPGGSGRHRDPSQLCPPTPALQRTLAVLRLAEALLLLREAVANTEASFNPPALPRLVPTNDAAAP